MDKGNERTRGRRFGLGMAIGLGMVVAVVAGVFAAGRVEAEQRTVRRVAAQTTADPSVVYPRQCAACHGSEGEGGAGPDIRTWAGTIEETSLIIADGIGAMPAFSHTLAPDLVRIVAVHLDELVGITVYQGFCASCHGEFGEGGLGPSLKLSTLSDDERRSAIADGIGAMSGFSGVLTPEELEAMVRRMAGYSAVGSTIFGAQCAPCHGSAGEGGTGPALAGNDVAPDEAAAIVVGGFGGMPAFGATLEGGDVEAVVAFLATLDEASAPTATTTTTVTTSTSTTTTTTITAGPTVGVDAYLAHCGACHGQDAEGGLGPSLVGGYSEEVLTAVVRDGKGSMPGFAALLSDGEIGQIVEFLESLSVGDNGGPVSTAFGAETYAQQCAACPNLETPRCLPSPAHSLPRQSRL
jgi:mono/diheme cytochrome c family protein